MRHRLARFLGRFVPETRLRELRRQVLRNQDRLARLERRLERMHEALGRIERRQVAAAGVNELREAEWQVFSQWGEDGALDWLVRTVPIASRRFVEFGVESYEEANTRFLLSQDGWSGLVIDGDRENVERIRTSRTFWSHDLRAVHAFVTRETIDDLLREHGCAGPLGVLSIDIDGVDWWIWDAIECAAPAIVVVEYNHRFGPEAAVTVPYAPDFDRRRAHHSLLWYGASLEALRRLGTRKGYALVGCTSHGLNAFFVRRDLLREPLRERTTAEAFVAGGFGEAHDEDGHRVRLDATAESALVRGLPSVEIGEDGRPLA